MMDYPATLDFLYQQLPIFQRVGKAAYKANLDNTIALGAFFKEPHKHFKSVHIAGTNGKGSTAHMLASVLQEAGYKTGLYTSPHLKDFRERIRINGEMIPETQVVEFVERAKPAIEQIRPSFFELTMLMAFEHFRKEEVDMAIIETGMGGRLDSTNIITPEVSVITNISMDHSTFLGNDVLRIAAEKAGIIKQGVPVIIGKADGEVRKVFEKKAQELGAPILFAQDQDIPGLVCDLKGARRSENARTAHAALKELQVKFPGITDAITQQGLMNVVANTRIQGRWQVLQERPKVVADIAHNEDAINALKENLSGEVFDDLHIVLGTVNDKEVENMLGLLPKSATYYFCKADIPRGLDAHELQIRAMELGLNGQYYASVFEAMEEAKKNATAQDLILVTGSAFVVAEIL